MLSFAHIPGSLRGGPNVTYDSPAEDVRPSLTLLVATAGPRAARRARTPLAITTLIAAMMFRDRKSTRLNSSHMSISYAVFCLKKKNKLIQLREYDGAMSLA